MFESLRKSWIQRQLEFDVFERMKSELSSDINEIGSRTGCMKGGVCVKADIKGWKWGGGKAEENAIKEFKNCFEPLYDKAVQIFNLKQDIENLKREKGKLDDEIKELYRKIRSLKKKLERKQRELARLGG